VLLDASPGHLGLDGGMLTPHNPVDVIVESGFAQSIAVFGRGKATEMWALSNPGVSLTPQDNVAVFTVRPAEADAGGMASQTLSLLSPEVQVSDAKVLDVIISKEVETGPTPLVLIVRHACKQQGTSQVTISLPQSRGHRSGGQIAFSYRKVCKSPARTRGLSLLRVHTTWDVPTYGWRVVLASALLFILGIVLHEFGHHYVSVKIIEYIQGKIGPEMFGAQIEVGKLAFRPMSGVFILKDFKIKNPPGFGGDFLLIAEEVNVLMAMRRLLYTFGRKVDIELLRLTGVHLEIEFPSFVMGSSNIGVVQAHLAASYQRSLVQQAELDREGIQPGCLATAIDTKLHALLERAKLHKAEFLGIAVRTQGMLGTVDLNISDMHFQDFSKENGSKGLRAICSKLVDVFYMTIKHDTLGETGAKVFSATEVGSSPPASGGDSGWV